MKPDAPAVLERISCTIDRYAMFRPGMKIGVAVSGGADSVCLLHILLDRDLRLHVLHLNHNLRGEESRADAAFVRDLAAGLQLPCTIRDANPADTDDNLEQAAREARLQFFREMREAAALERIALGHTRSDQAETVLFRFLRGSGTAGLAGIRPVTAGGIVRPLIEIDRAEIEQFLRDRGIPWREDASNRALRFARNRIRHELLPRLAAEWNPAIRETLSHTADWAQGEEAYWEAELDRISTKLFTARDGFVFVPIGGLLAKAPAVARRLVRRAMERAKGDLRGIDFAHIAGVLELASRPEGHGRVQAHNLEVIRSFDWLRFGRPHAARSPYRFDAVVPANLRIPGTDLSISLELIEKPETTGSPDYVYNNGMDGLDWRRLSGSLSIRNWQPGDRYHPVGCTGVEKIKTLFQHARIPLWERRQWPVLMDGESIVWVRRFGAAAEVAANSGSRSVLKIREVAIG